jgi:hypothetical protein
LIAEGAIKVLFLNVSLVPNAGGTEPITVAFKNPIRSLSGNHEWGLKRVEKAMQAIEGSSDFPARCIYIY